MPVATAQAGRAGIGQEAGHQAGEEDGNEHELPLATGKLCQNVGNLGSAAGFENSLADDCHAYDDHGCAGREGRQSRGRINGAGQIEGHAHAHGRDGQRDNFRDEQNNADKQNQQNSNCHM